jgi:hypothetical protein
MKKIANIFSILALTLTTACVNPQTGYYDPALTVGATAIGAGALGYIVGQNNAPRSRTHYYVHRNYYTPRNHYHYRWNHPHYRRF